MKVAAYQPARTSNVDEALCALQRALTYAVAEGIDLVCFPECYIGGYFPNDRDATERAAYEIESQEFVNLIAGIGAFEPTLVVGFAQRSREKLFNTAAVVRNGKLEGIYSKRKPNESFMTPGTECRRFMAAGTPFGINICNDANYPEIAIATARRGAEGIVMPLNNFMRRKNAEIWRAKTLANLVARARDTNCWVVSSDVVGETEDRISHGCTAIVDARGHVLAQVPEDAVGFVVHELS